MYMASLELALIRPNSDRLSMLMGERNNIYKGLNTRSLASYYESCYIIIMPKSLHYLMN